MSTYWFNFINALSLNGQMVLAKNILVPCVFFFPPFFLPRSGGETALHSSNQGKKGGALKYLNGIRGRNAFRTRTV